MFCKHCGKPTEGDAEVCEACASDISASNEVDMPEAQGEDVPAGNETSEHKLVVFIQGLKIPKPALIAGLVFIVAILAIVIGYFATRCDHAGCYNHATCGDYCEEHVCSMYPSCTSERAGDSQYCYYHKGLLEELTSKSKNISVSNVRIQREKYSSYVKATGTVKNNGSVTFDFVKVRAAFKDSKGNVVDTDWTFAVGSEGLEPGESATFELYVKDSGSISTVDVTVIDD